MGALQGLDKFNVSGGGGSNIKGIQDGTFTFSQLNDISTQTIPISNINILKSIVRITITQSILSPTLYVGSVSATLTDSTTLTLNLQNAYYSPTVKWEVIEFNNVKSKQVGIKTIATTTDTIIVSSINSSKSLVFLSFTSADNSTSNVQNFATNLVLTNATTLSFNQSNAKNKSVYWQLIEFN